MGYVEPDPAFSQDEGPRGLECTPLSLARGGAPGLTLPGGRDRPGAAGPLRADGPSIQCSEGASLGIDLGEVWQEGWHGFDTVIDVRAPAEFAEDHLPGAVSMPVLSDDERARVGTVYTQDSPFTARKIGAALVAKNAAAHIESHLLDKPGAWRPLVYCWRGGQRSGSFATILQQIGWRVEVLEGGYRSYRRGVVAALYDENLPFRMLRLDGLTGTGKTAVLGQLAVRGHQVLDLEALAGHRGSALGAMEGDQPAQKGFESNVMARLAEFDPGHIVLVEAESSRIGEIRLPTSLWAAMRAAPKIEITAAPESRSEYLAAEYADLYADPDRLLDDLELLRAHVGGAAIAFYQELAAARDWRGLALDLIQRHYDPAYLRARRKDSAPVAAKFEARDLREGGLADVADQIDRHLRAEETRRP